MADFCRVEMTLSIPLLSFAKVVLSRPATRPFGDGNFSRKQSVLSRSPGREEGSVRPDSAARRRPQEGF